MMRFDIAKFAEEFKQTIDWMLNDKYGDKLKDQIQRIEDNKIKLAKNPIINNMALSGRNIKGPAIIRARI